MEYIKNVSGSLLGSFDYDQTQFYKSYILKEKFDPNEYMQFGIEYEKLIGEKNYNLYNSQNMLLKKFHGYNIIGFIDFEGFGEWVEVKTKSGRWSESMIRKSRQFRIYNHYKGENRFILHQYNKLRKEIKIRNIGWNDETFETDLLEKIKEVEEFMLKYDFKFLNNKDV